MLLLITHKFVTTELFFAAGKVVSGTISHNVPQLTSTERMEGGGGGGGGEGSPLIQDSDNKQKNGEGRVGAVRMSERGNARTL